MLATTSMRRLASRSYSSTHRWSRGGGRFFSASVPSDSDSGTQVAAVEDPVKEAPVVGEGTGEGELDKNLKPSEIVGSLDRHIVGQKDAKKAVAIAMRNRWRRRQLPDELRKEVTPRNVLLVGPTGRLWFDVAFCRCLWSGL